jgi:hypothetical protein
MGIGLPLSLLAEKFRIFKGMTVILFARGLTLQGVGVVNMGAILIASCTPLLPCNSAASDSLHFGC